MFQFAPRRTRKPAHRRVSAALPTRTVAAEPDTFTPKPQAPIAKNPDRDPSMKWRGIDDTQDRKIKHPVARPPSATAGLSPDLIDRARSLGRDYHDPHGLALLEPLVRDNEPGHTQIMFHRIDEQPVQPVPAGCADDTVALSTVSGWCTDFIGHAPEADHTWRPAPSLIGPPLGPEDSGEHRRVARRRSSLAHTPRLSSAWFRLGPGCTPDDENDYSRSLAAYFAFCNQINHDIAMRTSLGRASRNTIQFTTVAAAEFPNDTTTGRRNAS